MPAGRRSTSGLAAPIILVQQSFGQSYSVIRGRELVEMDRVGTNGCRERLAQLEKQIARLNRRETRLGRISGKYWRARRILGAFGIILTIGLYALAGDRGALPALLLSVTAFAELA